MRQVTDLRHLDDAFVICRAIGHSWDENPTAEINSDRFRSAVAARGGGLFLRCVRCTTERFSYMGRDGNLLWNHRYRYPQNYRSNRLLRPSLRAEMLARSLLIRNGAKARKRAR